ncbi:MAG: YdcF family protein, partial [Paludibacteraceae bacterium]|nr:YdcF family protein [Paludibacteraceae bacterium]
SAYDVPSTYKLGMKYDYMMIYDDDITAVLRSIHLYRHFKQSNAELKLVLVGGEGLLNIAFKVMRFSFRCRCCSLASRRLQKETEAMRLKRVALELGVKEEDIIVSDQGHNTTENLQAMSKIADGKKTLVVSTQRLAMIFKQSADYQCNRYPECFNCQKFDYDMMVIHQSVQDILRWYNFQAAGNGRVALHFFASLVRRFEVYDNKFLTKPFEPSAEVMAADALLRPRFLIKQRLTGWQKLRALMQYIPILWSVFLNAEEYLIDENVAIEEAQHMHPTVKHPKDK